MTVNTLYFRVTYQLENNKYVICTLSKITKLPYIYLTIFFINTPKHSISNTSEQQSPN